VGYSTPNAIVLNNAVHLFYDVAYDPTGTNWKQVRLHHSWSNDGIAGWVQDATPIASVGEYAWNTDEIRSPDALLDGITLRLYYAGHNIPVSAAPNLAIAEKTCDLSP
jgi:sucrose-6-phosphate hydrolase SacC (GH32 family)